MTTRRKFLTTTGILAGMAVFGKLFSQKEETEKTFKQYCEDQVNNDIQASLWQDEVDRSKEFEGMGEKLSFKDLVSQCEPMFVMTKKDSTTYHYRGKEITVKGVLRSQMSNQDLTKLDEFLK